MANAYIKPKKRAKRLQARVNGYERMVDNSQESPKGKEYTRPGSYNK